jgi:hypothetical protein
MENGKLEAIRHYWYVYSHFCENLTKLVDDLDSLKSSRIKYWKLLVALSMECQFLSGIPRQQSRDEKIGFSLQSIWGFATQMLALTQYCFDNSTVRKTYPSKNLKYKTQIV